MYYVYIIESQIDKSWYYGYSQNVEKRLGYHNNGESRYTKRKTPWQLIFCRSFESKTEALKFEKYLKDSRNKEYIKRAFSEYFINRDVAQSG
ncbi:hypothetical protein GCM10009122_09080 [Fulvivirga kasyanovii]|uniref:GIY-YIG nuclease family protein n=1 Tax=Fulvivirga kasyanovii TaxID=396812 RepID=A0ABW9RYE5_9BACT|nr:GIY-YIG nuclease family protein [Fulvivirga kasyanovii]